jgi:hypothetical protein
LQPPKRCYPGRALNVVKGKRRDLRLSLLFSFRFRTHTGCARYRLGNDPRGTPSRQRRHSEPYLARSGALRQNGLSSMHKDILLVQLDGREDRAELNWFQVLMVAVAQL